MVACRLGDGLGEGDRRRLRLLDFESCAVAGLREAEVGAGALDEPCLLEDVAARL